MRRVTTTYIDAKGGKGETSSQEEDLGPANAQEGHTGPKQEMGRQGGSAGMRGGRFGGGGAVIVGRRSAGRGGRG